MRAGGLDSIDFGGFQLRSSDLTEGQQLVVSGGRIVGRTPSAGPDGPSEPGPPELSAYEVAVASGYSGDTASWLLSLKGAKGDTGADGAASTVPGPKGDTGAPGSPGSPGTDSTVPGPKGDKGDPGNPVSVAACWPIGSVFLSVVSTDPAILLGIGTWAAIGAGRVLVGYNASDTDFNAAEKTGGAKTVASAGTVGSIAATQTAAAKVGSSTANIASNAHTHPAPTFTGTATSVVQPYLTVFIWKRTA